MKHVVGIDTSLRGYFVTLLQSHPEKKKAQIFDVKYSSDASGAAAHLSRDLAQMLNQYDVSSLAGLIVGAGPGSFTGIKVGLAFAQGILRAEREKNPQFKVLSIDALAELAHEDLLANPEKEAAYLFLPATTRTGYVGQARRNQSSIEATSIVGLSSELLSQKHSQKVLTVDEAMLRDHLPNLMRRCLENFWQCRAQVDRPLPRFLRPSVVVENKMGMGQASASH